MRHLFLSLLLLCSTLSFSQTQHNNLIRVYIDGVEVLSYRTGNMELSIAPRLASKAYGFGKEIKLYVALKNNGETPIDFNPINIKAFTTKKGKKVELDIYTASEYLKRLKKNILWFGPDNVEKVNSATTIKDGQGKKTGEVESTVSVYTGEQDAAYSDAEEYVRKEYLKRNTVFSGQELNGIIAVENPKRKPFELYLKLGDEMYVFNFEEVEE